MIIGFWISLFVFIATLAIAIILGFIDPLYGYDNWVYWLFGIILGLSLFLLIFFAYYSGFMR